MDFKKIINITGKKIVDIIIWGIVLSGLLIGVLYMAGMITFTFDTNDLMYLGIAFAVGFVGSFLLNKKFGQVGAAPAAPGQPAAPPQQPAQPQEQPAAPPQQPAPAQ